QASACWRSKSKEGGDRIGAIDLIDRPGDLRRLPAFALAHLVTCLPRLPWRPTDEGDDCGASSSPPRLDDRCKVCVFYSANASAKVTFEHGAGERVLARTPKGAGDILDRRFEIERIAGVGGMGTVYRALDRDTGDFVALKVLRGDGALESARFAREAHVLS